MCNFNLCFSSQAQNDLDEISVYLIRFAGQTCYDKTIKMIMQRLEHLQSFPFTGSALLTDDKEFTNFRKVVVRKYLIVYEVYHQTIFIYKIFHTARDYLAILRSMK